MQQGCVRSNKFCEVRVAKVLRTGFFASTMSEQEMVMKLREMNVSSWRKRLGEWIESQRVQNVVVGVILFNAVILGLETDRGIMETHGFLLKVLDKLCLTVFLFELSCKILAFRGLFWRNGWNVFDFVVVAIALAPGTGVWSVLRSLRVLRVLRLLTVVPQLRRVVAAFLHAIPGLSGVIAVMGIFFFTAGVLATNLFGENYPVWFGSLGRSLYSLFQIMTLESWSMGIVRPVMGTYPWAWAFFIPFIIIATFTILNLFIGIIVSTMTELSALPEPGMPRSDLAEALGRIETEISKLRRQVEEQGRVG